MRCIYLYKGIVYNFAQSYLSESLALEVTISNKKDYIITLYRSPSQTYD